jgi:hypothetical protein
MTRISMIPGEPPRFEGRWANRSVNWFTGYVNGSATRSDTSVSGSIQTSSGGTVTGNISSATRVTDAFRLVNPKTQQESNFQLSGYHLQVWEHQLVSVAWVIRKGKESGPHFVVINHTTGDQFSNDRVLWRIFYPHADLAFVLMVLLCLPFPFVLLLSFAWGFAMRAEFARLMRTGIQPLREFLNQKARELA